MPRSLESRFECNLCRVAQNQEQMLKSWMRESCLSLFRTVSESQTRWRKESHEQKYKMKTDRDTHTHTASQAFTALTAIGESK